MIWRICGNFCQVTITYLHFTFCSEVWREKTTELLSHEIVELIELFFDNATE